MCPKVEVLMISSEFGTSMIDGRRGFVAGIDHSDQMMAYYPIERKSLKWYKKTGNHIFHLVLVSSYFMYLKPFPKIPSISSNPIPDPFPHFSENTGRNQNTKNPKTVQAVYKTEEETTKVLLPCLRRASSSFVHNALKVTIRRSEKFVYIFVVNRL